MPGQGQDHAQDRRGFDWGEPELEGSFLSPLSFGIFAEIIFEIERGTGTISTSASDIPGSGGGGGGGVCIHAFNEDLDGFVDEENDGRRCDYKVEEEDEEGDAVGVLS